MIRKIVLQALVMLAGTCFVISQSQASSFDSKAVESYINSLPEVEAFGEKMESQGKDEAWLNEVSPMEGENFDPHTRGISALKQHDPAEYAELGKIVGRHGFSNGESWAAIGDRVILAYGALKAESENPQLFEMVKQMETMDPSMLAMMPAEVRAQMEQAMVMARSFAKVPDADKQVVRPHMGRLDAVFMDR
ncbi:hypothetical protein [Nitrincola sp. MINF-07-Sa-05]|uniref:hypothetical protein n=1 Tax=Nitrincola salilacus TaxID=3400273 RepID=UPI0039184918